MDCGIQCRFALVTGGSHGIGRAVAVALADEGCHVAVCARNLDRLANTKAAIEARGAKAISVTVNVLRASGITKVMDEVLSQWGRVDILVNNVGGGGRWGTDDIEATPEEVWRQVYDKNAMAAIRFTMRAIPSMRRARGKGVIEHPLVGRRIQQNELVPLVDHRPVGGTAGGTRE